jgi:hypothetical protein
MNITIGYFFLSLLAVPRLPFLRQPLPAWSLLALAFALLAPGAAYGSLPLSWVNQIGASHLTSVAAAPEGGFWVQKDYGTDNYPGGQTVPKGGAPGFENISTRGSIAAIPGRNGYWVVSDDGEIFARGDAPQLCEGSLQNCTSFPKGRPNYITMIAGAAVTPTGQGLWAVGRDGKVWATGDAQYFGDAYNDPQVATGIVATPSGKGYYIVKEDGGVFSFGDAVFYGSTGGNRPGGHHLTGIALSIGDDGKVNGYWLAAQDGGVFTFGEAPFWGNPGINPTKVTSIVSFPAPVPGGVPQPTQGYALVHDNGNVGVHYRP